MHNDCFVAQMTRLYICHRFRNCIFPKITSFLKTFIILIAVIRPLSTVILCFHFCSEIHMQIYLDTVIISHLIGISLGIF